MSSGCATRAGFTQWSIQASRYRQLSQAYEPWLSIENEMTSLLDAFMDEEWDGSYISICFWSIQASG